jgi:TP901 family phage tail tape measure protein
MATTKVMNLGIEVTMNSKGVVTGVRQIEQSVTKAGKSAKTASKGFSTLTKAVGGLGIAFGAAGLVRGVNSAIDTFASFEEQIKNVQNITGSSTEEMAKFQAQISGLPSSLGSSVELTKGLYQALSSGVPKDNAIDFMVTNARAAKGNLADLTQTISASTSILAAFNLPAEEATAVLDSMTKTVDLGKLTFSDLANNIGKSAAIAASAGVSYNELFAASAQLTLGGLSVEEAMTGIRAIMTASISPTEQQAAAMQKYGVELSANAIQQQGFVGYMKSISAAVGSNVTAMAELFPNVRAIGPALALVREEGGQFDKILQDINNSSGKVDANFENMAQGTKAQMAAMRVDIQKVMEEMGERLAPVVIDLGKTFIDILPPIIDGILAIVSAVEKAIEIFKEWKGVIVPTTAALVTMFAVSKITAFVEGIGVAGSAISTLATTAKGAAVSVSALFAPFTIAAAAVGGTAAAIAYFGVEYGKTMESIADAENRLSTTQSMAHQKLQAGLALNGLSLQQFAEQIGAVKEGQTATYEATQKFVQGLIQTGKYGGLAQDVMSGLAHESSKIGKEMAKTARDEKKANEIREAAAETIRKLKQDMNAFSKSQADAAKNAKKVTGVISTGYSDIDEKIQDWILVNEAAGVSLEELREVGEDNFSALERKILELRDEAGAAFKDDLPQAVDEGTKKAADAAEQNLSDIDPDMEGPKKSIFNGISGAFSDALGKGFEGEWKSFRDLWDNLWQDAAKSAAGMLGDALQDALSGEGGFFSNLEASAKESPVASVLGGAGMVMQAREQGGAMGALQGAMGGMMAGAVFGPIGMAVGAVVGGLVAGLSKPDDPRMNFTIGAGGETRITAARAQKMSDEDKRAWERDVGQLYNTLADAYRGAFLAMGQDLWGMVGDAVTFDTGASVSTDAIHMDDAALLEWLGDVKLPELFESQYFRAFQAGLQNFGMGVDTIDTLFTELGDLSGEERLRGLTEFITTVRAMSERMEGVGWENLKAALDQDAMSGFLETVGEIGTQIDVMSGGWEDMDLLDVAREVEAVGAAFDGVSDATLQMLASIQQLRDGIVSGWDQMREDLALSQMTDPEKIAHFQAQVESLMDELQAAGTIEEVEEANSALMSAMQNLMGVVDPTAMMASGTTWGDWLDGMMRAASDTAERALDDVEDEVQAAYEEMVARVTAANDALMNFTENLAAAGDATGGTGYYDPATGAWIPAAGGPRAGESPSEPKTIELHQPISLQVNTMIDGRELQASVQAQLDSHFEAMSDMLDTVLNQEIID